MTFFANFCHCQGLCFQNVLVPLTIKPAHIIMSMKRLFQALHRFLSSFLVRFRPQLSNHCASKEVKVCVAAWDHSSVSRSCVFFLNDHAYPILSQVTMPDYQYQTDGNGYPKLCTIDNTMNKSNQTMLYQGSNEQFYPIIYLMRSSKQYHTKHKNSQVSCSDLAWSV